VTDIFQKTEKLLTTYSSTLISVMCKCV
jgi:hypothetical protein